jgi:Na+/H+-dicarboxylate symporter
MPRWWYFAFFVIAVPLQRDFIRVAILGIILPIYTIIDMVETAENVWSDSCVCAMTNHDLSPRQAQTP